MGEVKEACQVVYGDKLPDCDCYNISHCTNCCRYCSDNPFSDEEYAAIDQVNIKNRPDLMRFRTDVVRTTKKYYNNGEYSKYTTYPEGQQPTTLQCFWTWPWGHRWDGEPPGSVTMRCSICDKTKDNPPF